MTYLWPELHITIATQLCEQETKLARWWDQLMTCTSITGTLGAYHSCIGTGGGVIVLQVSCSAA